MAAIVDDILRGRLKVLFVSPERLTSASFRRLFRPKWNKDVGGYERDFPTVSLLCVDEAHCLSQWAHNFRPSYLRLQSMIRMIEPQSVLAITATAGPPVIRDICRALSIDATGDETECQEESGIKRLNTNRNNIDVSCFMLSNQEERLSAVSASCA